MLLQIKNDEEREMQAKVTEAQLQQEKQQWRRDLEKQRLQEQQKTERQRVSQQQKRAEMDMKELWDINF